MYIYYSFDMESALFHPLLRHTCTSFLYPLHFISQYQKPLFKNGPPPTNSEDGKIPELEFGKYFETCLKIKYSILIIINFVTITMINHWT
jgi:hypothetical protein